MVLEPEGERAPEVRGARTPASKRRSTTAAARTNALAEMVVGLYQTEVIYHAGPWQGLEQVKLTTLDWVHWFTMQRFLAPLGYVPPAKREAHHAAQQDPQATPVAA